MRTQKRLACVHRRGCRWAALEVSSHALAQGRADDIAFDYAVFSNLTRDHLDYHGSLAAYGAAKRRLFEFPSLRGAVINIGDDFGCRLARSLRRLQVLTYGGPSADLRWERVEHLRQGVRAQLKSPWGGAELVAPVCGDFGLANLSAAIGVLAADGLPFADIAAAAAAIPGVPGRVEFFRQPGFPTVVVDYAHTPDALAKVLEAVRRHCSGQLGCVVGCGGERDTGKRPMMARVAAQLADLVWLTSDNPRREDPSKIIADMAAGLADGAAVVQEIDRGTAIAAAIRGAGRKIWCWSPARAMRTIRKWPVAGARSATGNSSANCWAPLGSDADAALANRLHRAVCQRLFRLSVPDLSHHGQRGDGAWAVPDDRSLRHRPPEPPPDWPTHPRRRAFQPLGQGRHTHHGRRPDPDRHRRHHPAVGRVGEPLRLDRAVGDPGVRWNRLGR